MKVQSVALYSVEIWSKNQNTYQNEVQKLINGQACSITEMYPSTPIAALMSESGLVSTHIMLSFRQRMYAYRLFSLPEFIITQVIFPISLRIREKYTNGEPTRAPFNMGKQTKYYNLRLSTCSTGFSHI